MVMEPPTMPLHKCNLRLFLRSVCGDNERIHALLMQAFKVVFTVSDSRKRL